MLDANTRRVKSMLQTEYSFDTEFAVIAKEKREACILLGMQK